jgi:hypothetical protein
MTAEEIFEANNACLREMVGLELAGITFIRDYVQFLFGGPILNVYTWPQVKIQERIISLADTGYRDGLCALINKKIILAYEDAEKEQIMIVFEGGNQLSVSLKDDDRTGPEAAEIYFRDKRGRWNVW